MGRGQPFAQSVNRLISAGVAPRLPWMNTVESTRPLFEAIAVTKPHKIEYPEDRLRDTFLQRNHGARRMQVNMNARSFPERHIADKFVASQVEFIEEKGLSEGEAYNAADRILHVTNAEGHCGGELSGALSNLTISDEAAKLYLSSVRDSQRDLALHRALVKQSKETN